MKKMMCFLLCMLCCAELLPGTGARAAGEYTVEVWCEVPAMPGVPIVDFEALAGQTIVVYCKFTNTDTSNVLRSNQGVIIISGLGYMISSLNINPLGNYAVHQSYAVPSPAPVAPIVVTVDIPFNAPAVPYSGTFTFNAPPAPPAPSGVSGGIIEESEPSRTYQEATVTGVTTYANVRATPSTDADIIGQAMLGESISLLSWNADGTWCKIEYAGGTKAGWLHGKFIQP